MLFSYNNSECWVVSGDLLKFGDRCIFAHRHVRPRSWRTLQVQLQDRGALLSWNFFKANRFMFAVNQHRVSTGGLDITNPLSVFPQH